MGSLTTKIQLGLAILFGVYAYTLIVQTIEAYDSLKSKEVSRIVEDATRQAATLGDYLSEQQRFVSELTQGPEITNFLVNRALGMSLQYGLQTSLDAIEAKFFQTLKARHIGDIPLYIRLVFIDEGGGRLVDTRPRADLPLLLDSPPIRIDASHAWTLITVPVRHRGRAAGFVVAWSDLGGLARFLLPAPQDVPRRVSFLLSGDQAVGAAPGLDLDALARVEEGKAAWILLVQEQPHLVVRAAVPGTTLSLVSVVSEEVLAESRSPAAFLVIASVVPPLGLVAVVYLALLHRRQARTDRALRSSRLRLMTISDSVVEGIVMIGRDERVAFVNRPALKILSLSGDPPAYVGQPLGQVFRLADRGGRPPWLATIMDGATRLNDDATFLSASGVVVSVAYGCAFMRDSDTGAAAIVSFRDISSLKQAKAEAMQSARLASIGQLAAGIAHEINTPAQYIGDNLSYLDAGLQTLCAVVRDGEAGDNRLLGRLITDLPQAVAESREGVEQIARIVLSIREFSHPGPSARAAVDLNRALETTLTVSRNSWKRVAAIDRHLDPDLPQVTCHAGAINQVLLNLILNAVQAIETGSRPLPGRIDVATWADLDGVVIEISDTGPGVPMVLRERIFDPFFTTKPVGKGTGQGLAICLDIVTRHGGRITVAGEEGEGAVFTVRLPLGG
ncbi:sensor histidine kinase [Pararhodospirillum photometricum]|uniref:histidine kinase n=1 Tax=Pararhodospirillum photometricum DSM 122 TaxID=1150469 RepID=H6SM53_PARPM|nr:ATP-binding protein [Pararhodospirillum photometricum]CCG09068.1 Sensor protein [Pararhodospirillum photometricum DSM 122]